MTDLSNIQFPDHARVWIYQSNRKFSSDESEKIEQLGNDFATNWAAHGNALMASVKVIHDVFVVIILDENIAGATGCSIDKSVHFIKSIENEFSVQLTNRLLSAVKINSEIKILNTTEIKELIDSNQLDENSFVFDNTIQSLRDLKIHWMKPLKETWLRKYVS